MQKSEKHPARLLRLRDVVERTGLSRSTIYLRMKSKDFPASIDLGGARVAWLEAEIDAWIAERVRESRQAVGAA